MTNKSNRRSLSNCKELILEYLGFVKDTGNNRRSMALG
jgi:hypothetical protein